jgi:hypothetical protein
MNPYERIIAICERWHLPAPEYGETHGTAAEKVASCMEHLDELAARYIDLSR